jgi:hypothetical protein
MDSDVATAVLQIFILLYRSAHLSVRAHDDHLDQGSGMLDSSYPALMALHILCSYIGVRGLSPKLNLNLASYSSI